ncbi:MAG: MFS transporter [Hamadaea sp.]|nr:MFS transporter [Hamadaea sp.]
MTAAATGITGVLRAPQAAHLLIASLLGRLPFGVAPLALLLAARASMSLSLAAVVVAAYTAGAAIGQPTLSRLADRWRQPPVIGGGVALSTAGFLIAAGTPGAAVTIAAAAAAGLGAPPLEACLRVRWKDLVDEKLVPTAYTLDVTSQEIIFIVGPLLTLGSIAVLGPAGGLYAAAVVQLAGAVLFVAAPAARQWRGEPAPRHWAGPLRAARIRWLIGATALVGSGVGTFTVAITGYAEAVGGDAGPTGTAGWLLSAQAVGALAGGAYFARRAGGSSVHRLAGLVGAMGLAYVPLLATPPVPVMAVAVVASGFLLPPVLTEVMMSVDAAAPGGTAAEAFAWIITAFSVGSALGAAADGVLVDTIGVTALGFLPAPIVLGLAAVLLRFGLRSRRVVS